MEKSQIFELLDGGLLRKWRGEAEKDDDCGFAQKEKEAKDELAAELSEKSKKLLGTYVVAIENRTDYFYYNINIRMLNFGIKIGMELQKAATEFEE